MNKTGGMLVSNRRTQAKNIASQLYSDKQIYYNDLIPGNESSNPNLNTIQFDDGELGPNRAKFKKSNVKSTLAK